MKEANREKLGGVSSNGGVMRSAAEKERTKMRERQRRSITTNIFHGLRKHGGYRLSPRADINEVLRHLAGEAGWIVDPDGTTYRSPALSSNGNNVCSLCGGGGRRSAAATPSGSYLGGGGGECSTTASPRRDSGDVPPNDTLLAAVYMCGGGGTQNACGGAGEAAAAYGEGQQQQLYLLHEGCVSNQNTPAGSL